MMKLNRFALSLVLLGLTSRGGTAQNGQVPLQPPQLQPPQLQTPRGGPNNGQGFVPTDIAGIILNSERTQNADSLLLAYGQAVTDPNLARSAIAQLLSSYYLMRNQAQTAEQATQSVAEANLRFQVLQAAQNQVMIQQNQQLLEQNAQIIALLQGKTVPAPNR